MFYECFLQLRGEAGERQVPGARLAVAQNLGGQPGSCVAFTAVVGSEAP
jgi:acetyl-CoA C-acetyltransferase